MDISDFGESTGDECASDTACKQCCRSADPYILLRAPDPDPAIFVIDLQDANKKSFFCLLLLKVRFLIF